MTSSFAMGSNRCARSAPARASGLCSGSDGRACISSIATLLIGSSLACVHTTPIACSRSAFASGDIEACACVGFDCGEAMPTQIRTTAVKEKPFTQRRKDAKKIFLCSFAPLREIFSIASPVPPDRFALLHECFHTLIRVLRLHQLVQVDVFL